MHDLSRVIESYERLLETESDPARAAGWRTPYAREATYLSLARIDGLGDGSTVLDVGCGTGGLYEFFERAGIAVDYTGYDITPKAVEIARQRHPGVRFEVRDILRHPPNERFDVVLCAGALSHRVADQGSYVIQMIRSMYSLADVALGFSMLSAWSFMESPVLQREALDADFEWPQQIFRYCRTLSRQVTLNNDVQHGIFDVFVYRNNRGALERFLEYVKPGEIWGPEVEAAVKYHVELGLFAELRSFLADIEPCAEVYNHLGQACAQLGDASAAVDAFDKAIAADPSLPWPRVNLARLASRERDLEGAVSHLRSAVIAAPRDPAVREELVKALLAAGRRAEARAAIGELPEGALRSYLAGTASDDPRDALACYRAAIEAAPGYLDAIVGAAFACERFGDNDAALELWRQAERLSPVDRSIAERITTLSGGTSTTP
jgi:SAM-dependent methyltransferase